MCSQGRRSGLCLGNRAALLHISDESTFRERHRRAAPDHEVIEHLHVNQRERPFL